MKSTPLHDAPTRSLDPRPTIERDASAFDRCNLWGLPLLNIVAHDGQGTIQSRRILTSAEISGACNFMDVSVVPPGSGVGEHTHGADEEEYYLILTGSGLMRREGCSFRVRRGDLIRNPPGGTHALLNDGTEDLRMFVFELRATE
jgi:mannose-6-phosphate isomerase-like protein (cupin superfamily)